MAFDVITPVKILNTELPTANTILYTVDTGSRLLLKDISIANNNAYSVNVVLYLVDATLPAGNNSVFFPNISILGNSIFQWQGTQIMYSNDTIQGYSPSSGVCIKVSGGIAL